MTRPSLLWHALGTVRPHYGIHDEADIVASFVEAIASTEDPHETHTIHMHNGQSYSASLLARALTPWHCNTASIIGKDNPIRLSEQPALAVLSRGVSFWTLPEDQRTEIFDAIFQQEMWGVWTAVLADPQRPTWEVLLPQVWGYLKHHVTALTALLKAGLPADFSNHSGQTLLFSHTDLTAARWLIGQGADPAALDAKGRNAAVYHRSRLNAEDQKAWFDLCGRDSVSDEEKVRLAMRGNKAEFTNLVKKPGLVSWRTPSGDLINVLDGAIHAAAPLDLQNRYLTPEPRPGLLHHLVDSSVVWPEESRAMAALALVASHGPVNEQKRQRIEAKLAAELNPASLVAALPRWLPYLHQLDPESDAMPYAAWWKVSSDPAWRTAVLDAQLDKLWDDPNLWLEKRGLVREASIEHLLAQARGEASGVPMADGALGLEGSWAQLSRRHRFVLAAWDVASNPALSPTHVLLGNTEAREKQKAAEDALLRQQLRLLTRQIQDGEPWFVPEWNGLRQALAECTGEIAAQLDTFTRQLALDTRPAAAPRRPRPRA